MEPLQALPPGTIVYGADGESIGTVESADDEYAVVDTGDFPPYLYIPIGAIVETRPDGAYLAITGEDARNSGWGEEPVLEELPESAAELGIPYSEVEESKEGDDGSMRMQEWLPGASGRSPGA